MRIQFVDMSDYNWRARAYWWTSFVLGAFLLGYATTDVMRLDGTGLLGTAALMGLVFLVGLRPICIPGTKTSITSGDIFMFLAVLLWGVSAGVLVAMTDAFAASYRTSRRWTSRLGSPAMIAIALFISGGLFEGLLGWLNHFKFYNSSMLFAALLLFSLIHFVLNSTLVAVHLALKKRAPLFALWWENYAWAGLTYTAGASAAGLIYLAIKQYGIGSLLAAGPIVSIIFATCYLYFKRADEHDKATRDTLTGLLNRTLFMQQLKHALARRERHPDLMFAVLFLDFDRFKLINDSLGHLMGDQLLIGIADRLEKSVRPGDTVARLGGDEFTILLEYLKSQDEAIAFVEIIEKNLMPHFMLGDQEVYIGASIGIALSNSKYQTAEEILQDADTAMYRAKSLGKGRHVLFDQSMNTQALNLLQLETDLRHAVERREFSLAYQPNVSLETGQLVGFEALVRWRHSERGAIAPRDFIPLAEQTGHIMPIGQWVLEEACCQMRWWQDEYPHLLPLTVNVNLSVKQFAQPDLVEQILLIIEQTGLEPRHLNLEITESTVIEDFDAAIAMLEQLRARGVRLSIDDFGTGYSSLSYLHRLPVDTLKIDRSFTSRITTSNENAQIVQAIIVMAKNLGMEVIAEGVETWEQLECLRRWGCDYGQGFLFSEALEAEAADQLVRQMDQWQAFIPSVELSYTAITQSSA